MIIMVVMVVRTEAKEQTTKRGVVGALSVGSGFASRRTRGWGKIRHRP